jgi:CheY-like chemotaxis protein
MRQALQHEVLVVEDDSELAAAICSVLEVEGCATASAETGDSALALLAAGLEPCVVLLDMHMPGMPADQFLRELRKYPAGGRLPVVVLTGLSDPLPALAVDRVLRKPFPLETLIGVVDQHCGCSVGKRETVGGPHPHRPPWKMGTGE